MPQLFHRRSNALVRMGLVLAVLIAVALGIGLDRLQRAPWVTRQGEQPTQPVSFSHRHHVQGMGVQCQYCHVSVEKSSYAGIPATRICMNCHLQMWPNALQLEPVRQSWLKGESIPWVRVNDLPDFVSFDHSVHVNKGVGCVTCHGQVDQMNVTSAQYSLQMEWCLDCHRNPAKNLRPASEVYNMAWQGPSESKPLWCVVGDEMSGMPTSESVNCTVSDPLAGAVLNGTLTTPSSLNGGRVLVAAPTYEKFTSQEQLGRYLVEHYKIRNTQDLMSCEVCHR